MQRDLVEEIKIKVEAFMKDQRYTDVELAKKSGIAESTIYRLRKGYVKNPSKIILKRIAIVLGFEERYFLEPLPEKLIEKVVKDKKIRSCPFCGNKSPMPLKEIVTTDDKGFHTYTVQCSNFKCGALCGWYSSKEEALSSWQTRVKKKKKGKKKKKKKKKEIKLSKTMSYSELEKCFQYNPFTGRVKDLVRNRVLTGCENSMVFHAVKYRIIDLIVYFISKKYTHRSNTVSFRKDNLRTPARWKLTNILRNVDVKSQSEKTVNTSSPHKTLSRKKLREIISYDAIYGIIRIFKKEGNKNSVGTFATVGSPITIEGKTHSVGSIILYYMTGVYVKGDTVLGVYDSNGSNLSWSNLFTKKVFTKKDNALLEIDIKNNKLSFSEVARTHHVSFDDVLRMRASNGMDAEKEKGEYEYKKIIRNPGNLSDQAVHEIINSTLTQKELAVIYGKSITMIGNIKRRAKKVLV